MSIKNNTTGLQALLETVTNLPDANSGVELPELANEGTAEDLLIGKELIDDEGNKVTGTFTIEEELSEQDSLIAQIASALEGKASGSGGSGGTGIEWISYSSIPSSFAIEPGAVNYFIQLPNLNCFVLFCSLNGYNGIKIGCYDTSNGKATDNAPILLGSGVSGIFEIIEDSGNYYLQFATGGLPQNGYYAIVPIPEL